MSTVKQKNKRSLSASTFGAIILVILFAAVLTFISREKTMAAVSGTHTLFTAVQGVVTNAGAPVSGARVLQSAKLGAGAPVSQEAVTDQDGRFSFPQIEASKGLGSLLPQQFAVGQEILIERDGKEYVGWLLTKYEPQTGAEIGADPIKLVCELMEDTSGGENHVGICRLAAD